MKIEQLEYFLTVSQYQNISQAAEQLFIGQSTLSTAIKTLEKELNLKLFRRTNHGVILTAKGEQILPVISNIVTEFNRLKTISNQESIDNQELSLSLNPLSMKSFSKYILPKLEYNYYLSKIQLRETFSGTVIKDIINAKTSIGVSTGTKAAIHQAQLLAQKNNLTLQPLKKKEELRVIVDNTHPLASRHSIAFHQLFHERFALFEGSLPSNSLNTTYNRYQNFSQIFLFSNQHTLIQAIAQNNLVAILPYSIIEQYNATEAASLVGIPLTNYDTEIFYYYIYSNKNQLTLLEKNCLQLIQDYYDKNIPEH